MVVVRSASGISENISFWGDFIRGKDLREQVGL